MKLLLLTRRFPPHADPIATWSLEMARRLAPRCEDFAVCGVGAGTSELGRPSRVLDELRSTTNRVGPISMSAWDLASARERAFDAVLGADWMAASLGLCWRGRSPSRRVFAAVHGPELEYQGPPAPLGRLYRRAGERALAHVDAVFAASGQARVLVEGAGVRRCALVGRACDPERFRPHTRGALARQLGFTGRRVLMSVGQLEPERRIDKVLFAVSALGVRYPELCYVVVGDGPERQRLSLLAERLRIAHKVRFLGSVGEGLLPEVYNLCDVFVHLSGGPRDALHLDGQQLIEALACARPTLLTARAAEIEGIDERAASVVPEDDSSALCEALVALLDGTEQAAHLGQRARAWVLANATWEQAADRLLCALHDALRGIRRRRDAAAGAQLPDAAFAER